MNEVNDVNDVNDVTNINDMGKVIFDKKTMQILKATNHQSLTTKQISKQVGLPTSALYYPIKKLLEINALKIEKEEQVKNLTEYYYSSKHLRGDSISIEGNTLKENELVIIQSFLFEVHKATQQLSKDLETFDCDADNVESTSELSYTSKQLSAGQWKEINQKIRSLINSYEENSIEEKSTYNFLLASYKNDDV